MRQQAGQGPATPAPQTQPEIGVESRFVSQTKLGTGCERQRIEKIGGYLIAILMKIRSLLEFSDTYLYRLQ